MSTPKTPSVETKPAEPLTGEQTPAADSVGTVIGVAGTVSATSEAGFDGRHPVIVEGAGASFILLSKTSCAKRGWSNTTRAMEVPGGALVQVTIRGSGSKSVALTFVPGVKITDGQLVPINAR